MAARKAIITGAATAGVAFASANPANTAAGAAGGGEGEWVNVLSSADVEDGRRLIFSGRAARSDDDLIRAAECDIEAHDATRGALSLRGLGLDESQAKKLVDLGSSLAEDPVSSNSANTIQHNGLDDHRCLHVGHSMHGRTP